MQEHEIKERLSVIDDRLKQVAAVLAVIKSNKEKSNEASKDKPTSS